jgi:hypothetical protein
MDFEQNDAGKGYRKYFSPMTEEIFRSKLMYVGKTRCICPNKGTLGVA